MSPGGNTAIIDLNASSEADEAGRNICRSFSAIDLFGRGADSFCLDIPYSILFDIGFVKNYSPKKSSKSDFACFQIIVEVTFNRVSSSTPAFFRRRAKLLALPNSPSVSPP